MITETGRALRERAQGRKAPQLQQALVELDGKLGQWSDEFIFGDVWDGDEMSFEECMLVAITALAATGRTNQLRNYLHGALQNGIPADKLQSALRMLVVYIGFPGAIGALQELQTAVKVHERAQK
ncbi:MULTISPECIES: carboxymuconolactone decarboxylase family protein [Rhodococcus]|uniref:Carboxymuconolactone decarboxylase family protein n=2 Tax=Nocardiaceae TaxID=85025 RepID=A0AAX3YCV5_RHOOP|nr:carboxymuconolactone decarboxylase family protein [Rhodococcus opacus]MDI9940133.1 carboxymuconolactone decarboxylase family protein [Rhodococcus sp. IEGM 1351]NDV07666.1 carboxymuconolactone decarboxylase family protein [Rhodococcus sp. IEGM 248]NHU44684.1 carboxymuconolactone decarboxylase family protein [Rhodococcus sp. A14]MCZ4587752.1 carboxymuconolactone decarboxylase family protein [Rhodococcus opacus]MDV6242103.1 carboxymuconolactone decarboxylase family protein [Rhodococcus opacus]